MKVKHLLLLLTVATVLVAGFWLARSVRRATKDLVSVHVRNAPLADVVRTFAAQTQEKIVVPAGLEAKVTLDLDNTRLCEALDKLAEQAGADWNIVHAVYRDRPALRQLDHALREGSAIIAADWTNLAPRFDSARDGADEELAMGGQLPPGVSSGGVQLKLDAKDASGASLEESIRKQLAAQGVKADLPTGAIAQAMQQALQGKGGNAPAGKVRIVTMNRTVSMGDPATTPPANGSFAVVATNGGALSRAGSRRSITINADGTSDSSGGFVHVRPKVKILQRSADGKLEELNPADFASERIVMEMRLSQDLGDSLPASATRAEADRVAAKVRAKCETLYVLRRTPGGGMSPGRIMRRLSSDLPGLMAGGAGGTNGFGPSNAPAGLEDLVRREQLEKFIKLTPEQRAARVRETQSATPK